MVCIRHICILGLASLGACAVIEPNGGPSSNNKKQGWTPSQYCRLRKLLPVIPSQTDTEAGTGYYTVTLGETCWDIIARNQNKFTMSQLLCWNTDINPWCSNLIPGRQVCVAVSLPGLYC